MKKSHHGDRQLRLATHNLKELVNEAALRGCVNATPRIKKSKQLNPTQRLIDLEHYALSNLLNNYEKKGPETIHGWVNDFWWLTGLPQTLSAFRKSEPQVKRYLIPDGTDFEFMEKNEKGALCKVGNDFNWEKLGEKAESRLWLKRNYQTLLERVADQFDISEHTAALKYGEILFPESDDLKKYSYADDLGAWKK